MIGDTMSWQKYYDWLQIGIDNGWVSEPICFFHDGPPLTDEEMEEFEKFDDICVPGVRLYGQEKVINAVDSQAHDRHPVL